MVIWQISGYTWGLKAVDQCLLNFIIAYTSRKWVWNAYNIIAAESLSLFYLCMMGLALVRSNYKKNERFSTSKPLFSVLLSLLKMGLIVKVYYASEVCPIATQITNLKLDAEVYRLEGDVRNILNKLDSYGKIDFLFASPPCDKLSKLNPNRDKIDGMMIDYH